MKFKGCTKKTVQQYVGLFFIDKKYLTFEIMNSYTPTKLKYEESRCEQ